MKDPYSILGVPKDADIETVREAYRDLARKYHPDNYSDDDPLKSLANEKMQQVNAAYEEILAMRTGKSSSGASSGAQGGYTSGSSIGIYAEIRKTINDRRFGEAERMLGRVEERDRTAEWHYLAAVLLMHRGRQNDAMRELEIACNMDPSNMEYQKAKEMFNGYSKNYGNTYYNNTTVVTPSAADTCCNTCSNLICLDCCCECMGGDLIPCL